MKKYIEIPKDGNIRKDINAFNIFINGKWFNLISLRYAGTSSETFIGSFKEYWEYVCLK